jgi:acyl carrier protein
MESKIRDAILEVLNQADNNNIENSTDLELDSIDFVRVVIALEDAFDIEFDEFDLSIEAFKTIQKFIDYIKNQLAVIPTLIF